MTETPTKSHKGGGGVPVRPFSDEVQLVLEPVVCYRLRDVTQPEQLEVLCGECTLRIVTNTFSEADNVQTMLQVLRKKLRKGHVDALSPDRTHKVPGIQIPLTKSLAIVRLETDGPARYRLPVSFPGQKPTRSPVYYVLEPVMGREGEGCTKEELDCFEDIITELAAYNDESGAGGNQLSGQKRSSAHISSAQLPASGSSTALDAEGRPVGPDGEVDERDFFYDFEKKIEKGSEFLVEGFLKGARFLTEGIRASVKTIKDELAEDAAMFMREMDGASQSSNSQSSQAAINKRPKMHPHASPRGSGLSQSSSIGAPEEIERTMTPRSSQVLERLSHTGIRDESTQSSMCSLDDEEMVEEPKDATEGEGGSVSVEVDMDSEEAKQKRRERIEMATKVSGGVRTASSAIAKTATTVASKAGEWIEKGSHKLANSEAVQEILGDSDSDSRRVTHAAGKTLQAVGRVTVAALDAGRDLMKETVRGVVEVVDAKYGDEVGAVSRNVGGTIEDAIDTTAAVRSLHVVSVAKRTAASTATAPGVLDSKSPEEQQQPGGGEEEVKPAAEEAEKPAEQKSEEDLTVAGLSVAGSIHRGSATPANNNNNDDDDETFEDAKDEGDYVLV